MLNAGIDCGAKYSFFYKLHQHENHNHSKENKDCAEYDYIYNSFNEIVKDLQKKGIIDKGMTVEWIQNLHTGIIISTVNANYANHSNKRGIRDFAWKSFINGISV
jgi:hypothetical protein